MFWDATVGGLSLLLDWQVYAASLLFLVLAMGPMLALGFAMEGSGRAAGAIGCLSVLILPFFQTFALLVFVLTLSPVILGLSTSAAWGFPWQLLVANPGGMALIVLKLLFVAVLLAFVPLIGRLHSLHILLLGSFALAMVIGVIEEKIPNRSIPMWPGFWFVVGLVVIGSALGVLGMFAASMVAVAIDSWSEGIGQLIAFPIAAAFGFIPLFIYGAWLARQVHGG